MPFTYGWQNVATRAGPSNIFLISMHMSRRPLHPGSTKLYLDSSLTPLKSWIITIMQSVVMSQCKNKVATASRLLSVWPKGRAWEQQKPSYVFCDVCSESLDCSHRVGTLTQGSGVGSINVSTKTFVLE